MQPEKILESDSLDILFEHRNKEYGAYELRKKYNKRLLLAMAMGLLVISLPVIYVTFKKFDKLSDKPDLTSVVYALPPVSLEAPKPPPQKKAVTTPTVKKPKVVAQSNSGKIEIVKEEFIPKIVDINEDDIITIPGLAGAEVGQATAGNGNEVTAEIVIPAIAETDPNIALPVAEQMPAYPGGLKALRKFLERNLESPRSMEEGEKINVRVKFIVGYDGNLKSFELEKDGGDLFNKEVMRVIKLMPRWIPGKNAGKNVSVYFSLPVSFVSPE